MIFLLGALNMIFNVTKCGSLKHAVFFSLETLQIFNLEFKRTRPDDCWALHDHGSETKNNFDGVRQSLKQIKEDYHSTQGCALSPHFLLLFPGPYPFDLNMLVISSSKNIQQGHKLKLMYLYACQVMHMRHYQKISKWNSKGVSVARRAYNLGEVHPRRLRGYQSGRCDIFRRAIFLARKFTSRAEVVEIRPTDWKEKYFSGHSTRRSSWVILSPSYTKWFSSSIDLVSWQELHASPHIEHITILSYPYISIYGMSLSVYGHVGQHEVLTSCHWPAQREDSCEEFQNKDLTKRRKSQTITWELKIEAILFHQFSWRIYRRYIVNL